MARLTTLEDSIAVALQQRIHPQIAVAFDLLDEHAITWVHAT